jgi:hypothetical protein
LKQQELERLRQQQEMERNPLKSSVWASKSKSSVASASGMYIYVEREFNIKSIK